MINLVFLIDTILQFFLPYKRPLKLGGGEVKNHRRIACHYVETWFFIDLVSLIPIDYILLGLPVNSNDVGLLGATRMLRLLRLIKLVRILRASRIFARWENSICARQSLANSSPSPPPLSWHWLPLPYARRIALAALQDRFASARRSSHAVPPSQAIAVRGARQRAIVHVPSARHARGREL